MPTQFSATPPARQRFFMPVCACKCRTARSMISSVTAWIEAAKSISRWVKGASGRRGGPPNSRANFREVITSPWQ